MNEEYEITQEEHQIMNLQSTHHHSNTTLNPTSGTNHPNNTSSIPSMTGSNGGTLPRSHPLLDPTNHHHHHHGTTTLKIRPSSFSSSSSSHNRTHPTNLSEYLPNQALLILQPQANLESIRHVIRHTLVEFGHILHEYILPSHRVRRNQMVDKHFGWMAQYATEISPHSIPIQEMDFYNAFGESWTQVLKEGRVFNAREAMQTLEWSLEDLHGLWIQAEENQMSRNWNSSVTTMKVVQLSTFVYCARIPWKEKIMYIINGFYVSLRRSFLLENATFYAILVGWDPAVLSWKEFNHRIMGHTNPSLAMEGSLRRVLYDDWKQLGMKTPPTCTAYDHGIFVSDSPWQGLVDRYHWTGIDIKEDDFGRVLLGHGIPESQILTWCTNPWVCIPSKTIETHTFSLLHPSTTVGHSEEKRHISDIVVDLDADECVSTLLKIYDFQLFGDLKKSCHLTCTCSIV